MVGTDMSRRSRKAPESIAGTFSAIPHSVLDSRSFQAARHTAKALLYELMRQVNGRNNGHLQLYTGWLKGRGWKSADVVQRAKNELIHRGLIVQSRQGGLNIGPSLYAVSWLSVSNFVGLDITAQTYAYGRWRDAPAEQLSVRRGPRSALRSSAVPADGAVRPIAVPSGGAETPHLSVGTVPPAGNNVFTITNRVTGGGAARASGGKRGRSAVVGRAGRSGKRPAS